MFDTIEHVSEVWALETDAEDMAAWAAVAPFTDGVLLPFGTVNPDQLSTDGRTRPKITDQDPPPFCSPRFVSLRRPSAQTWRQSSLVRCEPACGPICSMPPSTAHDAPVT
jgi:hypothetical protein